MSGWSQYISSKRVALFLEYNLIKMLENIQKTLQTRCQVTHDQCLIVGVSGGPDSLCLLDILDRLGYRPIVTYFNHKLRPEAKEEAERVAQEARRRNFPFLLGELDILEHARRWRNSVEEAAREARYQFLFAQAREHAAQAVCVGHTADDQVETVLMHFLRGAALEGLAGMSYRSLPNPWSQTTPLIRPLLGIWRKETLAYCQERDLRPVFDPSNQDRAFFRNRLRHELLPYLETYNPAVRRVIWNTAEVLRGDLQVVDQALSGAWDTCFAEGGSEYISLDREKFCRQSLAIQRRIFRRAIGHVREDIRDVSFEVVSRALDFIHSGINAAAIDLVANLKLVLEPGRIWIVEWGFDLPVGDWPVVQEASQISALPAKVDLPGGWKFVAEILPLSPALRSEIECNADRYRAWLARETVELPLIVRHRLSGDRFTPLGMEGHIIKLSDFMINEKIPVRARDTWPLVCHAGGILWVPGYRIAHPYRVGENTREVIRMQLVRPGGVCNDPKTTEEAGS